MKKLTRVELQKHFKKKSSTVQSWTRGFYLRYGERIYYYSDHRKLEPCGGTGAKFDPFVYTLKDATNYLQGIILDV